MAVLLNLHTVHTSLAHACHIRK